MFYDLKRVSIKVALIISIGKETSMDMSMTFLFQQAKTHTTLSLFG